MAAPSQATVVSFMRVVVNAVTAGAANRSRSYPTAARLRRTHNLTDRCRPGRRSYSRRSAQLHRPLRRHRPSHRATNRLYRRLRLHRVGPRAAPLARCLFAEERCRRGPLAYSSLVGKRTRMALTLSRRRAMSSRRRSMSAWSRSTDRSTPDSRPSTRPMRHATPMTERNDGNAQTENCAQFGRHGGSSVTKVPVPRRSGDVGQWSTNNRPCEIVPASAQHWLEPRGARYRLRDVSRLSVFLEPSPKGEPSSSRYRCE